MAGGEGFFIRDRPRRLALGHKRGLSWAPEMLPDSSIPGEIIESGSKRGLSWFPKDIPELSISGEILDFGSFLGVHRSPCLLSKASISWEILDSGKLSAQPVQEPRTRPDLTCLGPV